ncbi:hypothetical protein B0A54_12832 [Friedmanniomyces endolithicus]|uniref:Cyclic nucleotide-binding domain-containing protein n=1 Tax=Friedmanniomyces endolithicus TaxID=329885 RepID=A0A4U0ULV6_9PEZI|nr:hypothetical protein LTS09_012964 [Friedmanniomyces endolithicus]TKA36202.1 hypothetical protein B0A54_12832 [Friedmanniomyces endolithicus]
MRRQQHSRPSRPSTIPPPNAFSSLSAPTDPLTLLRSFDASLNPSRPVRSSPLASSTIAGIPFELLDRLKAFPLFASAPESFLLSIGRSLRPNIYQTAQEIIREGEDAKAMYWLVRGSVRVTSRDGESTYAELKPASIVASSRSLVVRLNKEDLRKELPRYPDVEGAIREEAVERLSILERKKQEKSGDGSGGSMLKAVPAPRKRSRDWMAGDVVMSEAGSFENGEALANKRRKSPSPISAEISSVLGDPPLTVRALLKELPLFAGLPNEILHFLGKEAQPVTYAPFTEIIKQDSAGRDVFFIIKGDVEVLTDEAEESTRGSTLATVDERSVANGIPQPAHRVRARLKGGQYFGEVTSLSLSPRRTATVRSVNAVECLLISGQTLDELWQRCTPDLRLQVEREAKRRMNAGAREGDDVIMADAGTASGPLDGHGGISTEAMGGTEDDANAWRNGLPTVTFEVPPLGDVSASPLVSQMEPVDPDPFFSRDLDNMRAKSRRSSLAPPLSPAEGPIPSLGEVAGHRTPSPPNALRLLSSSPLKPGSKYSPNASPSSPVMLSPTTTRRPSLDRRPSNYGKGRLPNTLLLAIVQHLELLDLMRCRLVSTHWWDLISTSPELLQTLNLARYNRYVSNETLRNVIIPFIGTRQPKVVDISNCFHISDEGFRALTDSIGPNVKIWRMKSVWDVTGPAVLALIDKAKHLEEIDLSNCRKVGDNLLARVVGWVVPEKPLQPVPPPSQPPNGKQRLPLKRHQLPPTVPNPADQPPPGTIIGAPHLRSLTLSYCKHIQDRSMLHLALHASSRLTSLDLTRCTSISDAGFHAWGSARFPLLSRLVLADCTYLSDQAIVGIVGGCRGLKVLDLSFCCALSDTATEVLALGLPRLERLNMAFCGSAVGDNSLRCIGLHLLELRFLSVRGCVRVTGVGVEAVVEGCGRLEEVDVSQCKNLKGWREGGGVERVRGRGVRVGVVAGGG